MDRNSPSSLRPNSFEQYRHDDGEGSGTGAGWALNGRGPTSGAPAQRSGLETGERSGDDTLCEVLDLRAKRAWADPLAAPLAGEMIGNGIVIDLRDDESVTSVPTAGLYVRRLKPMVDWLVAGMLLVVLAPLMAVIALILMATLGRPILFRQKRVGKDGVPFVLWKFRTMRPDRRVRDIAPAVDRRVCHKSRNDPRHTRFGRALRCTRMDELPQLLNVLVGDMSLVGPRPELTEIVAQYEPWQHDRHLVRPGLTGLWQVSVVDDTGLMHEHTDIDLEYIRGMDLRTDLRILLRTPVTLVLRRGS